MKSGKFRFSTLYLNFFSPESRRKWWKFQLKIVYNIGVILEESLFLSRFPKTVWYWLWKHRISDKICHENGLWIEDRSQPGLEEALEDLRNRFPRFGLIRLGLTGLTGLTGTAGPSSSLPSNSSRISTSFSWWEKNRFNRSPEQVSFCNIVSKELDLVFE